MIEYEEKIFIFDDGDILRVPSFSVFPLENVDGFPIFNAYGQKIYNRLTNKILMNHIVRYNKDNTTDFEAVSFNIIQKTDASVENSLQLTIMTLIENSALTDQMVMDINSGKVVVNYIEIFEEDNLETPIYESAYWNSIESAYVTYNRAMTKLQVNLIFVNRSAE